MTDLEGPSRCVGCGDELNASNAYVARSRTARWLSRCRPCTRAAARERYYGDPEVRERKRSSVRERYHGDPELREKQKARRATPEGRERIEEARRLRRAEGGRSRETEQERERYKANKEAISARRRRDEITCEWCGGVFRGTRGLRSHKNKSDTGSVCKPGSPA